MWRLASVALLGTVASEDSLWREALSPFPILQSSAFTGDETLNFLSATLGDHMVLQRAPKQAVVWGHAAGGAVVTTTFNGRSFTSTAGADGVWRQPLPAMPASIQPFDLGFAASTGESATLSDVLFGDVYVCGGQSNMQFSLPGTTNATGEAKLANDYPSIRLFTVGTKTSSDKPLHDLQTIQQRWAVADEGSVSSGGGFGQFSSVCWFFGRRISDALAEAGEEVPLGLISDNWGGTQVEAWSPREAFDECERTEPQGNLYNAMIHPYTIGPMALSGFTWYQGESNTYPYQKCEVRTECGEDYACLFPAMISAWRKAFANPDAYFGFVQLSTWCGDVESIPQVRDAQMRAFDRLHKVGYATNADYGDGCNIHPPTKQVCGRRLGDSALAVQYGHDVAWLHPSFDSARVISQASADTTLVEIMISDVVGALTTDIYPFNYQAIECEVEDAKTPGTCAWAAVELAGMGWINATVSVGKGGKSLILAVPGKARSADDVTGTSYGWGPVPMLNAYDQNTGLPVLPWNTSAHAVADSVHARSLLIV